MSKTVIGIFETEYAAHNARNYLLFNGFTDANVDIRVSSSRAAQTETVETEDEDLLDKIGNFFKELFSGDDEAIAQYSEAGKRGPIVTVHAATLEEAEAAMQALDEHGAVDVNERYASDTTGQVSANPIHDHSGGVLAGSTEGAARLRSRMVDRSLDEELRLRQQLSEENQPPLNKTVKERDSMLDDILDNENRDATNRPLGTPGF